MFTPPDDVDLEVLRTVVRDGWRFDAVTLEYQAVGFGSHHWLATAADGDQRFVTVDVLSAKPRGLDGLRQALDAAYRLRHNAGLSFVVSAERTTDGQTLSAVGDSHAVAVYALVDGTSLPSGPFESDQIRESVLRLVAAIHAATPAVVGDADRENFSLPDRDGLELALEELDRQWDGGPYSELSRRLLAEHAGGVRRALAIYDQLVDTVVASDAPWVITHGEPHAQNIIVTNDGLVLIDWDTALIAPPERDLWMLTADASDGGLGTYAAITGHQPDADALMLYRFWWDLGEVAWYTTEFRRPHRDTTDSQVAWGGLRHSLAAIGRLA